MTDNTIQTVQKVKQIDMSLMMIKMLMNEDYGKEDDDDGDDDDGDDDR